uniref:Dystrophin n=1 Tax=Poecilia mexicana TaxID=48701 RepID=A0A3B3XGA0_9TELE
MQLPLLFGCGMSLPACHIQQMFVLSSFKITQPGWRASVNIGFPQYSQQKLDFGLTNSERESKNSIKEKTVSQLNHVMFDGRAHLEASAERWSRLLGLLEELWRWICTKDEELAKQMPVGGDVPTLLQQQNHCMEREHLVISTLDQARMFLADQPIEGPGEPRKNLQPKTEEKARGLARAIRKQTGEVRERWERLKGHVGGWQAQVEQALERLQDLQSSMDQLDLHLTRAEETKATWQPVGDLLIDSLQDHIDKTSAFREEITPLRQDVRVVNELAAELTPLDIQLSSTASRQLDQLNMRWKSLQVAVEDRLKLLQEAHRDFGPSSQHFLSSE